MRRSAQVGCLLVSLGMGFLADYPWGDWVGHPHWAKVARIPYLQGSVSVLDIGQNLLLFSPVGLFCARLFQRRPATWAALLTLPVSFVGEWTQVYSHGRFPSATDVANNVIGAWAAAWLCRTYSPR